MLTVTKAASARLARKLDKKKASDKVALRFIRDNDRGGWLIRRDRTTLSDVSFLHEGRTVLILDEKSSRLLSNKILDEQETDEGLRLRLRSR